MKRRHLTPSQRAAVAVEMLPLLEKEAAERRAATLKQNAAKTSVSQKIDSRPTPAGNLTIREIVQPVVVRQSVPIAKPIPDRNESMAAAEAAKLTGTNRQYVAEAKKLKEQAPQHFERLKSGEATLPEITRQQREERREERRDENREKVAQVPAAGQPPPAL